MTADFLYEVGEFKIRAVFGFFGHSYIMLPENAPIENPDYINALATIQKAMPYLKAVGDIEEYHVVYMGEEYDRADFSQDKNVLTVIEAYEKDLAPVPEHVYRIAIDLRDHNRPPREKPEKKQKRKRTGYVYLLQAESGLYKIGKALDPSNRHKTFGVQLPFQVEFICTIKSDDYDALELELHETFKGFRVKGEWFNLAPEDVEYIKGLAAVNG